MDLSSQRLLTCMTVYYCPYSLKGQVGVNIKIILTPLFLKHCSVNSSLTDEKTWILIKPISVIILNYTLIQKQIYLLQMVVSKSRLLLRSMNKICPWEHNKNYILYIMTLCSLIQVQCLSDLEYIENAEEILSKWNSNFSK